MKKGKFNYGAYVFAGVMGLLSGLSFSKSLYYKGGMDASQEIVEELKNMNVDIEES